MKATPVILLLLIICGCTLPEEYSTFAERTHLIIWDPEGYIQNQPQLFERLQRQYTHIQVIKTPTPNEAIGLIEEELAQLTEKDFCFFLLLSENRHFHLMSEWNLWFPSLWRNLPCEGKILISDAPWGDEYLNPVKLKHDSIWAINGLTGQLRPKLEGSYGVASCRFDEINLVTRGLEVNREQKMPLFSWYILNGLLEIENTKSINLNLIIQNAVDLTRNARSRGIISDSEELLFFKYSQYPREEFLTYPHPVIWNGLAEKILVEAES